MDIKSLTIDSYDSIIALWESAGLPYKPEGRDSREEMKKQLERDPDLTLGAFEEDELIGVIMGTDDGRKGWINRLAVLPKYTRRGVASKLIHSLEYTLRKRGRKIICTLVEDWNEVSLDLFKKAGYEKHEDIFYLSKREGDHV
ncbi:MAG: GNAT family N-acetyltransferase [Methanomassiliicoccales archaeon]|nr:MAG: GNAT family N-acetyltransferase [Methanomassiliicoccales archaeon]